MNTLEIDELVRKYYDGVSTLAEERMLSELFLSGDYPPEYETEAMQFRFLDEARRRQTFAPGFESHMEKLFAAEKVKENAQKMQRRRAILVSVFAVFIIVTSAIFTIRQYTIKEQLATQKEEKELYVETQKALLLLSGKYNTGLDKVFFHRKTKADLQTEAEVSEKEQIN